MALHGRVVAGNRPMAPAPAMPRRWHPLESTLKGVGFRVFESPASLMPTSCPRQHPDPGAEPGPDAVRHRPVDGARRDPRRHARPRQGTGDASRRGHGDRHRDRLAAGGHAHAPAWAAVRVSCSARCWASAAACCARSRCIRAALPPSSSGISCSAATRASPITTASPPSRPPVRPRPARPFPWWWPAAWSRPSSAPSSDYGDATGSAGRSLSAPIWRRVS